MSADNLPVAGGPHIPPEFRALHVIYCRAAEVREAILAATNDGNRANPTWLALLAGYHGLEDAAAKITFAAHRARWADPAIYEAWRKASAIPKEPS